MKVILTGATGMIGKGVLLECLESPRIDRVLVITRRSLEMAHPKLAEVIHQDFLDFEPIADVLKGYDACFHCMGVSSFGLSEKDYFKYTYSVTEALAKTLHRNGPGLSFIYVTGAGTDSSENGNVMWARIKGKSENMLFGLGFKDVYAFRPGGIVPEKGVRPKTQWVRWVLTLFRPAFPLLKCLSAITTTSRIGRAMISVISEPVETKILTGKDINRLGLSE